MKCSIEQDQIDLIGAYVAKLLENSEMFRLDSPKDYVKNVYDMAISTTNDKITALNYARLVPMQMMQIAAYKAEYLEKLAVNPTDLSELMSLPNNVLDEETGLQVMADYLGVKADQEIYNYLKNLNTNPKSEEESTTKIEGKKVITMNEARDQPSLLEDFINDDIQLEDADSWNAATDEIVRLGSELDAIDVLSDDSKWKFGELRLDIDGRLVIDVFANGRRFLMYKSTGTGTTADTAGEWTPLLYIGTRLNKEKTDRTGWFVKALFEGVDPKKNKYESKTFIGLDSILKASEDELFLTDEDVTPDSEIRATKNKVFSEVNNIPDSKVGINENSIDPVSLYGNGETSYITVKNPFDAEGIDLTFWTFHYDKDFSVSDAIKLEGQYNIETGSQIINPSGDQKGMFMPEVVFLTKTIDNERFVLGVLGETDTKAGEETLVDFYQDAYLKFVDDESNFPNVTSVANQSAVILSNDRRMQELKQKINKAGNTKQQPVEGVETAFNLSIPSILGTTVGSEGTETAKKVLDNIISNVNDPLAESEDKLLAVNVKELSESIQNQLIANNYITEVDIEKGTIGLLVAQESQLNPGDFVPSTYNKEGEQSWDGDYVYFSMQGNAKQEATTYNDKMVQALSKSLRIAPSQAKTVLEQEFAVLNAIKEHINKDAKTNRVALNIANGSNSIMLIQPQKIPNTNDMALVSSVSEPFTIATAFNAGGNNTVSIKFTGDNGNTLFELEKPAIIDSAFVPTIKALYFNQDLKKQNGDPYSLKERINLITSFVNPKLTSYMENKPGLISLKEDGSGFSLTIDSGSNSIQTFSAKDLLSKEGTDKAMQLFDNIIGARIQKQGSSYSYPAAHAKLNASTKHLKERSDIAKFDPSTNTIKYEKISSNEYLSQGGFRIIRLSSADINGGEVRKSRSYITYDTPINVKVNESKSIIQETSEPWKGQNILPLKEEERKKDEKPDVDPLDISKIIRDLRTTPAGKDIIAAEKWWRNSPLSKVVPFNLLWEKVNSKNPDVFANWTRDGITLFKGADWTDMWHESYHSFSQGFLTKKEKQDLYNSVRKYGGTFTTFQGKSKSFDQATDREVEEYLAEAFRTYMINGQKTTKGKAKQNGFFRKLFNALKALFSESSYFETYSNPMSDPLVLETFNKLKSGNFSVESFNYENNATFGTLNLNVIEPSKQGQTPLNYRDSGDVLDLMDNFVVEYIDQKNSGRSEEQQEQYLLLNDIEYNSSLTGRGRSAISQFIKDSIEQLTESNIITPEEKSRITSINILNQVIKQKRDSFNRTATNKYSGDIFRKPGALSEAYQYAYARFQKLSNKQAEVVNDKKDRYDKAVKDGDGNLINRALNELQQEEQKLQVLNNAVNNFGERTNPKIALTNGYKDVTGFHILNSKFFDDMEYFAQESIAPELVSRTGYVRKGNEDSLKALAKANIVYLFSTLPEYDSKGNIVFNKYGVAKKMDMDLVWNNVAKVTENTPDFDRLLQKLTDAAKEDKTLNEIFTRLGVPTSNVVSFSEHGYWTDFFDAFNKARVPLIQVTLKKEVGENEDVSFTETVGQAFGADKKIGTIWNSRFRASQPNNPFMSRDNEGNYLNTVKVLQAFPSKASAQSDRLGFFQAIGFDLSDKRNIIDTIKSNPLFDPQFFWERISAVNKGVSVNKEQLKIRDLNDLYSEIEVKNDANNINNTLRGNAGTWNRLIQLEARFGDHVNNYMTSNAEGNAQFEHTLNNTMTTFVNDLNNAENYYDVINQPHLSHVNVTNNPFSNYNGIMNQLFYLDINNLPKDKKYGDRTGNKLSVLNLSGLAFEQNDNVVGKSAAGSDEYTKIIMDMALFKKGYYENMRHADKGTSFMIKVVGPTAQDRHVKLNDFKSTAWKSETVDKVLPALFGEMSRISILQGYDSDKNFENYDFNYIKNGQNFQIFQKILPTNVIKQLREIIGTFDNELSFQKNIENNTDKIKELTSVHIVKYFERQATINNDIFEDRVNRFTDSSSGLSPGQLVTAFTVNHWLHNYDSMGMIYGDVALYNHVKQEFHKRNAGAGSTGTILRTDQVMRDFINNKALTYHTYAAKLKRDGMIIPEGNEFQYGETLNSAVIKEMKVGSIYYNSLVEKLGPEKARDYAEGAMQEADAQGLVTFDSYRALSIAQNEWSNEQELLYRDVVNGVEVDPTEVAKFFQVKKFQYWGPLGGISDRLNLVAFHKYSLMPLIPSMVKGTKADDLHKKMIQENIQYVTFESGSKVSTIHRSKDSGADRIFEDGVNNRTLLPSISNLDPEVQIFTKNVIYTKYLKNQLDISNKDKGSVVFSTQLRKLVADGLLEEGVPKDFMTEESNDDLRKEKWEELVSKGEGQQNSDNYKLLKSFEGNIKALADLYKDNLLREVGITFDKTTGEYKGDISSLVSFMKKELKDDLPDHAIKFMDRQGRNTKGDLSLSFYAAQIEKVLNSILVKRLVTSKVNGEALVQVASTLFENKDAVQSSFANPSEEDLSKYGTNGLRFYREAPNGDTLPMDVKVSLRGKFQNLLDLSYNGQRIGDIKTLNIAIKDEEWLDAEDHRQMITMTAVRIPVQGLNSMEFMQVREFLPAEAGNIIISPSEVVSKSGADYDVDKMTVMMPNIERKVSKTSLSKSFLSNLQTENPDLDFSKDNVQMILDIVESTDFEALTEPIDSLISKREGNNLYVARTERLETIPVYQLTENDKKIYEIINSKTLTEVTLTKGDSKSAIENRLIKNISDILSLKSNYNNLVTPNSTALFTKGFEGSEKSLVETVGGLTREYNVKEYEIENVPGEITNVITDALPATSIFEYRYNMLKHQENKIGKEALGLGAVDNTYNILFNNVGAYMNPTDSEDSKETILKILDKVLAGEEISKESQESLITTNIQTIFLDHNTQNVDNNDVISLSKLFPKGITSYSISDVINQLMNGWVDVAKGGWVFDVQATKEVSPTLLAMVQAGVPIDQAVFFVANPLTRAYVEKQKFVKSVVYDAVRKNAEPVNKRNYRNIAFYELLMDPKYNLLEVLKDNDLLTEPEIYALEDGNIKGINQIIAKLKLKVITNFRGRTNKKFTMEEMKGELTDFKENKGFIDNKASRNSIEMLLHFMQLEKMALPIRDIKMTTNVDTAKDTTVFDAYDRENKIKKLRESNAFPEEILEKLLTDSAISPFYIQDLQLSLAKILQPLRNSEELNNLLLIQAEDMDLSDKDMIMFKNDFVPYMWQKTMEEKPLFNDPENPSYKRRDVKTELTVEKGILPKSGVAIKDGVVILDQLALENQWLTKSFIDNQFFKTYGKAPIPSNYFTNAKDYIKFSIEREVQRETKPLNKRLTENIFFQNSLSVAESVIKPRKEETLDKLKSRQIKYAYESFLRDEALMANFNIKSIFTNPTGNFADRFFMVKGITPDLNKFKIFEAFELDKKKGTKISNLKYSEMPDILEINSLKEEMSILRDKDLLKQSVPTLSDVEIENITDVFNDFPIVAFLQTGLNTGGRYSINNIVEEEYAVYFENALNKKDFAKDVKNYKQAFDRLIKTKAGRSQMIRYKDFNNVSSSIGGVARREKYFDERELYDIMIPSHTVLKESDVLVGNRNDEIIIKSLSTAEQASEVSDAILKDYKGDNAKVQKAILEKLNLVYSAQDVKNLLSTPEKAYTFLLRYQKLYNSAEGSGNFFSDPKSIKGEDIAKASDAMYQALGDITQMSEIFLSELRQKNVKLSMRLQNAYLEEGVGTFKYDSILEAREKPIKYTKGQSEALNKVQDLIDDVNTSKGTEARFFLLAGYAGTGKTTIAENIQQYAIDQGFKVKIAAPTNKAVNVLRTKLKGKEKDFNTMHKMLYGRPVDGEFVFKDKSETINNTIFLVDEASMINEALLRDLKKELEAGSNNAVVFLGDSFQLAPVGLDPKLFNGMPGMEMVELTEVRRQSLDSDILTLATLMREDKKAYEPTESTNDIKVTNDESEFERDFINDIKNGVDAVMLTGSNKDRVRVNKTVRNEIYGADAESVVQGETLIAIANRIGIKNGEINKLDDLESIEFEKTIDFGPAGKQKVVAARREGYAGIALIFPDVPKASMLSDDIIKGSINDREFFEYLRSNNMIAYNKLKEPYLSSSLESPLTMIATYGYAITGHKSQGSQWDNVYVNQGNERNWGPRWMYTAITRAAEKLIIKKSKFATLITPKQMKSKIDEVIRKNATAPVSAPDITKDLKKSATEVKTISMQPDNAAKIISGEKTTTLRTSNLESGVYDIEGQLFNLTNRGKLSIEEAGGVDAITKSEAFAETGPKFQTTKDFLAGKTKLYVLDISPATQLSKKAVTTPVNGGSVTTIDKAFTDGATRYFIDKVENLLNTEENRMSNRNDESKQVAISYGPLEYRYSMGAGRTAIHTKKIQPDWMQELSRNVEKQLGKPKGYYNHVLINRYGDDVGIGTHTDAESIYDNEVGEVGSVAIYSIGETKNKHKIGGVDFQAKNNSLAEMSTGKLSHSVGRAKGTRYSINFRHIPPSQLPATEVSINTKKWTKDSPKENPTTAYVFTENINSIGDTRVGKGSAVIRNNPNAIGIVTKKYYFYSENRNTPQALKIKEEYKGTTEVETSKIDRKDLSFKKGKVDTFTLLDGREVEGTAIIIEGQPNTDLFTYNEKGYGWAIMDNKSKQAFPLTQFFGKGADRKSDVLDAFASDLTKFFKKESNIKLLESIGFTFSQAQSQSAGKGKQQWYNQNFQDTNADFELFQKINLEQFDKLDQFDSKKFPDGFANSLASVPNRFALWLQNQLKTRYGLITEVNAKGTGLISKSVIQSPQKTVKGISISSSSNDTLGAALTNPTELAKSKGKISKSYPITYKNKTYKDVEEAYQALKDTSEAKTKPDRFKSKNYALMVDLLQTKLATYTELPTAITAQGGTPWILGSTHQPTNQNTVWETGGQNWFIEALNESYSLVQSSLQSRDIDTSVKNIFTITPMQGRPDKKASIKASIATKYIGYADNIPGSSTANYARQAGEFANVGEYTSDDIVFVSISGERGAKKFRLKAQQETIYAAMDAIDAGAVILTDNKAYTFDPKNTYNSGERMLFEAMSDLGHLYNEIEIDGEIIGTWKAFDGSERKIGSQLVKSGDRSGYITYPNFMKSIGGIKKYEARGIMIVNGSIDPNDKPGTRTNDEIILKEQVNALPLISMASYGLKSGKAFSNVLRDIEVDGVMKIDPKVQEAIDDRLDAIEDRVFADKIIEFSSEGYGMDMLNTLPNSEKRLGVQTWLYLSKQLFEKFGYINPGYNTSVSGSAVIQSTNQNVTETELTEKSTEAVLDYIKMCKI